MFGSPFLSKTPVRSAQLRGLICKVITKVRYFIQTQGDWTSALSPSHPLWSVAKLTVRPHLTLSPSSDQAWRSRWDRIPKQTRVVPPTYFRLTAEGGTWNHLFLILSCPLALLPSFSRYKDFRDLTCITCTLTDGCRANPSRGGRSVGPNPRAHLCFTLRLAVPTLKLPSQSLPHLRRLSSC